eukprot:TRINITY_DN6640_c0_g1_i6.p1 TRINITY_DN6640_c0_g1~~TRINITY_DN6640_c0_g1_i6.p1  ORF type:complete len:1268 (-),score=251.55 TRINITY_DN6640_c0_g1_i6:50-3853(-)
MPPKSQQSASSPASNVLQKGFLTQGVSREELIKRLNNLGAFLQQKGQDQKRTEYRFVVRDIISASLLRHKDREVRLQVACCLSDILRIFAPGDEEEPDLYTNEELKEIFELFIQQLQGIAETNAASFPKYMYLLDRLAAIEIFSLLPQIDADKELTLSLFNTLFQSVQENHPHKVESSIVDILLCSIEESDALSNEIIDSLLGRLTAKKKGTSKAYQIVIRVIQKAQDKLQPFVSQMLNDVIVHGKTEITELSGDIHEIIYELTPVAPNILLHVLPNLVSELKVEDAETRIRTVQLLGRLFASESSHLASSYLELFTSYLSRFRDVSPAIRKAMVATSKDIAVNHPELSQHIWSYLVERLQDADDRIRLDAVAVTSDVASLQPSLLTFEFMEALFGRARDKKGPIRKEAISRVAALYWDLFASKDFHDSHEQEVFGWIPRRLISLYATEPESDIRLLLESIVDERLIHPAETTEGRAEGLLRFLSKLDDASTRSLVKMMNEKSQLRKELGDYVELRLQQKGETSSAAWEKLHSLAKRLPDAAKARETILQKLHEAVDNRIFKNMRDICSDDSRSRSLVELKADTLQRLAAIFSSKSPVYDYAKQLLTKLTIPYAGEAETLYIVEKVIENVKSGIPVPTHTHFFIQNYAAQFPGMFASSLSILEQNIDAVDLESSEQVLKLVSIIPLTTELLEKLTDLEDKLMRLVRDGSFKQARYAGRSLGHLFSQQPQKVVTLFEECTSALSAMTLTSPSLLEACLQVYAILGPVTERLAGLWESLVNTTLEKPYLTLSEDFQCASIRICTAAMTHRKYSASEAQAIVKLLESAMNLSGFESVSHLAARLVMKASRYHENEGLIRSRLVTKIASLLLKSSEEFRKVFLSKLQKYALRPPQLSSRFVSLLSFYGLEENKELKEQGRKTLTLCIKQRREYLKSRQGDASALFILPENILPYVIYFGAHEDTIRAEIVEGQSMDRCVRYLAFFLEPIMHDVDNYVYLLNLLGTMKFCRDANPEDRRTEVIHALCDLSILIIKQKAERKAANLNYPGEIHLPRELFEKLPKESLTSPLKSHLPSGFTLKIPAKVAPSPVKKKNDSGAADTTTMDDLESPKKRRRNTSTSTPDLERGSTPRRRRGRKTQDESDEQTQSEDEGSDGDANFRPNKLSKEDDAIGNHRLRRARKINYKEKDSDEEQQPDQQEGQQEEADQDSMHAEVQVVVSVSAGQASNQRQSRRASASKSPSKEVMQAKESEQIQNQTEPPHGSRRSTRLRS